MSLRLIRIFVALVGALLVVAAAYTAYWYSAADGVRSSIDRWVQDRRAAGWTVALGKPQITGFPLHLEVFFQTPQISDPGSRWRWVAPNIRARATPWSPREISVTAPGVHVLTLRGGALRAELNGVEVEMVIKVSTFQTIVGRLSGVAVRLPRGERLVAGPVAIQLLGSTLATPTTDVKANTPRMVSSDMGISIKLDARKVVLPADWRPALGPSIDKIELDSVIMGEISPVGSLEEALRRWRDGGGTVEVAALAIEWGVFQLRTRGTFALDTNLQPEGATVADIRGVDTAMEQLLAAGVIDPRAAFAARIAGRALSFAGGSARLPLSLQKQQLYIGPVPILKVKTIRWN